MNRGNAMVIQRAEWTSMVAHDLRQPINTIAISADVLARASFTRGEYGGHELDCIRRAVKALTRLTSDLLDASCIEARRMSVQCAPVNVVTLVRDAIDHVPDLIDRCHIYVEPDANVLVRADAGRVEQILGNLLANAVKYGEPEGKIGIDIARLDREARVTVSNRGPGIPAHSLARIFDRFERTPEARKARPGLGLGLYIAKELIEAQGGRIWAKSAPGIITQFHFTLPLAALP
jgi:signal transduction histidine kinase